MDTSPRTHAMTVEAAAAHLADIVLRAALTGPRSLDSQVRPVDSEFGLANPRYVAEVVATVLFPIEVIVDRELGQDATAVRRTMRAQIYATLVSKPPGDVPDLASIETWDTWVTTRCVEYSRAFTGSDDRARGLMAFGHAAARNMAGSSAADPRIADPAALQLVALFKFIGPAIASFHIVSAR